MSDQIPESIQRDFSLKNFNTFGLEAKADAFVTIHSEKKLQGLLANAWVKKQAKMVLGGGSNMLLAGDLKVLVLRNEIRGIHVLRAIDEEVLVAVGGGEEWHDLVLHALEQNWGGLENLSLIPGKVGASPIQNIGAYGVELKDIFVQLRAINLATGALRVFEADECAFGYRDSIFKQALKGQFMITEVVLRLSRAPHTLNTGYGAIQTELATLGKQNFTIRDVSNAVIAIRQSKLPDPAKIGNSGSFFKNPEIPTAQFDALKAKYPTIPGYVIDEATVKVPAGWLIEQAGWKGYRRGNYGVHSQQALVLVNYGGANGADIYALSQEILDDVAAKFGIALEREVNVLGGV